MAESIRANLMAVRQRIQAAIASFRPVGTEVDSPI
jgi:hypothetical protein